MNVFVNGRVLRGALLCVICTCVFVSGLCAESVDKYVSQSKPTVRRPWIMVGLTPEGCAGGCRRLHSVIRELSGNPNGLILHFSQVTPELVSETQPEFIVLSPQGTPWCRYTGERGIALQNFLWVLPLIAEEMNIPILGICGGHQALALAFGGKVGPIRAGEDDCMAYSRDRQTGFIPLTVTSQDPIFGGIEGNLRIVQSHYDEVKILPPGFVLLASERISPNQIIRHPFKPVYGIQGHPESSMSSQSAGGTLIRNFLKIALDHNHTVRNALPESPKLLTFKRPDRTAFGN
ncbi:MAG: gamma-glutamyl-gamma-aminobutyrate hydrolase family protein [Desulfomonile sp.]